MKAVARWSRGPVIAALGVGVVLAVCGRFWFGSFGAARAFVQGQVLYTPDCCKDFGLVPYEEKLTVAFNVTNVTTKPLTIVGAKASCGCTVVESLPLQLRSGEEKELSVRVILPEKPVQKRLEGQILLYTDVDGPRLVLAVSGNVKAAKPDSIIDSIPPVQPAKPSPAKELSPPPDPRAVIVHSAAWAWASPRLTVADCALALGVAGLPITADPGLAKSLLERSMKAISDPAFFHALEMRIRGKVLLNAGKVKFDLHYVGEAPDRFWEERTLAVDSHQFKSVQVINGDRGWTTATNKLQVLERRELEREKKFRQMFHIFSFFPDFLNDSSYSFSTGGDGSAQEVFLDVRRKDEPPIRIFF